jgi:hypothetical protein
VREDGPFSFRGTFFLYIHTLNLGSHSSHQLLLLSVVMKPSPCACPAWTRLLRTVVEAIGEKWRCNETLAGGEKTLSEEEIGRGHGSSVYRSPQSEWLVYVGRLVVIAMAIQVVIAILSGRHNTPPPVYITTA